MFRKKFVTMTDPNMKFGRQAILTPMRCVEVVGEDFLPEKEELYLHLKLEEVLNSHLIRLYRSQFKY